jgi:hypothetical protein
MSEDNMKARDLIQNNLTEAEGDEAFGGTPPGTTSGQERPMRRPGPGGPPNMRRMMQRPGRPEEMEGPQGFFNSREQNQLKDIVILTLANLMGSEEDTRIGQALAAGKELDPGQLQHILDEASRVKGLPDSHKPILQKIYTKLTAGA